MNLSVISCPAKCVETAAVRIKRYILKNQCYAEIL